MTPKTLGALAATLVVVLVVSLSAGALIADGAASLQPAQRVRVLATGELGTVAAVADSTHIVVALDASGSAVRSYRPDDLQPVSSAGLTLSAQSPSAVELSWSPVAGAASVQVLRNGVVLDRLAPSASTYTVRDLWQQTSYGFTVRQLDVVGTTLASVSASIATPARVGSFPRLYAANDFINTAIPSSPSLDGSSSAIVTKSIVPYASGANLADNDYWGMPVVYADWNSPRYSIACTMYLYRCTDTLLPQAIPTSAAPTLGSDHHLAVMQPNGDELDMWVATHVGDTWTAGTRFLTRSDGSAANCTPGEDNCYGTNAAHFANMAGIVRPEEIAQGHIDHALVMSSPYTRSGYIACPATGTDGQYDDPAAIPLGAHVQLDPTIDVTTLGLARWQVIIARALQRYGAYAIDTGGSLAIRAEANIGRGYDAWAKAGVPTSGAKLSAIPWSRTRVLSMTQCPRS